MIRFFLFFLLPFLTNVHTTSTTGYSVYTYRVVVYMLLPCIWFPALCAAAIFFSFFLSLSLYLCLSPNCVLLLLWSLVPQCSTTKLKVSLRKSAFNGSHTFKTKNHLLGIDGDMYSSTSPSLFARWWIVFPSKKESNWQRLKPQLQSSEANWYAKQLKTDVIQFISRNSFEL